MIKRTIKYTDYNGNAREEDYYFHMTKAELVELEVSAEGGVSELFKKIIKEDDKSKMIVWIKQIIDLSYGERSPDGSRFIKSPELLLRFKSSAAYDALFMDMIDNAELSAEFARGIMPAGLVPN